MSDDLEILAMRWLRLEKRCPLAFFERGPSPYGSRPDALGITLERHLVEIEIKRTVSDFRANASKRHVIARDSILKQWPRYFYFLMPNSLAAKLESEIPDWAGLLTTAEHWGLVCVKQCPANREGRKISVRQCLQVFRSLGNQILSTEMKAYCFQRAFIESRESGIEYQI